MSAINDSRFQSQVFFLTGIPGQEHNYLWISVPFCLMYAVSIVGNSFIVFVIKTNPSLHEPMYILLSMLAVTDLALSITTMLTTLRIYLLNSREIAHDACFTQLYFILTLICIESSVLLLMAFDRLIAICDPLRYTSILTPRRLAKMLLVCVLRGVVLKLPLPIHLKQHQYCREIIPTRSYCTNGEVMKMACSDITFNIFYGLWIALLTEGLDSLLILLSYVMILKTVLNITSHTQCLRALNTCVSHLCAVLSFYTPYISVTVMNRFMKSSSPLAQILLGYIYVMFPPLLNPIVYSVKSKHLRARIVRIFVRRQGNERPKTQAKASCSTCILSSEMT
ncbi:olfactory receptor 51G2-like [Carettochelys insculpta]|uniref:olfactory receptor 51G2-like n=1 Tax=Carettochelys insculpta TaxID=44489 RepID=UPI003EBA96B9